MIPALSKRDIRLIRTRLRQWFQATKRDLPWRRNRDPYAIWISEVMLQQTQVTTVIPFFERFMQRFPTTASLAEASEQEVLRYWEGLGYYRRARHLHQAAQIMVQKHQGTFPHSHENAKQLPGLGRYTVGAVLSQSFDTRLPVVDANVARVLCRLVGWKKELEHTATKTWLWETATDLLPQTQVGEFNQALMELGQIICSPKQPACLLCPVRDLCQGRALGIATSLPTRRSQPRVSEVYELAVIIRKQERLLLCLRHSDASRWANMWEFPTSKVKPSTKLAQAAKKITLAQTGCQIRQIKRFGAIHYGITRFKVTLIGMKAEYVRGQVRRDHYQNLKWVTSQRLAEFPLSVPQRRLAALWLEHHKSARP